MDAEIPQDSRKRRIVKRSRTGCRTCRARRIKCDEAPGACNNCTNTKRLCDGYDVHRIPTGRGPRKIPDVKIHPAFAAKLQWKVTSDESRCLAFFQHQSVPQLVASFDSPVWQQLILQLCYIEPAVFHAVTALGAVNQAYEIVKGAHRRGKSEKLQNKWFLYALEQSGRSFAILNKRRMSGDPQLQTIILVCCLLFVMCELLHRNVDNALFHIQGGLRILKGMRIRRHASQLELTGPSMFEECLVETFLAIQDSSVYYGTKETVHIDTSFVFEQPYHIYLQSFSSFQHARKVLRPLMHTLYLFIAQCMTASDAEIAAMYITLQRQQQLLLYYLTRFLELFETFCVDTYGTFSFITFVTADPARRKEARGAELTRLTALYGILAAKISLFSKMQPLPAIFASECKAVIEAAEIAISKFHGQAPTVTTHHEIVPALYIAAFRCPDYSIRCRAIDALRDWQSEEAFLGASLNADLLEETMKMELKMLHHSAASLPGVTFKTYPGGQAGADIVYRVGEEEKYHCVLLERNKDFVAELRAIDNARDWPCVRATGLLDHI